MLSSLIHDCERDKDDKMRALITYSDIQVHNTTTVKWAMGQDCGNERRRQG